MKEDSIMAKAHDPWARTRVRAGGRAGFLALSFVLLVQTGAQAACDSSICGASPCTISGTHTIDSGCVLDFGTKDVILAGTLQGDSNASCYSILADDFTVNGTLRARSSCIEVTLTGTFTTTVVSNSAAIVDVRSADDFGDGVTVEAASIVLNGKNVIATGSNGNDGGSIVMTSTSGSVSGSSPIEANGLGGGSGGEVSITSEGDINLTGGISANGVGEFAFGGAITLDAGGSVTTDGTVQAQGSQGGDGGSVDVLAGNATNVGGNVNVNGNGDFAFGGIVSVDTGTLSTDSTWNARGDQSGYGGDISIAGTGLVETTSGTGSFNVLGGSGGGDGGYIDLFTDGDVDLAGDMDAAGIGEFAFGGIITVAGGNNHTVTVASTSRIEADSSGTDASNGEIDFSACNIDISGALDTRNTQLDDFGANTFTYNGDFDSRSGSQLLADDGGGNNVYCKCVDDVSPFGTCDSPATCESPPAFAGTVNPTATIIPIPLPACG
jgi:hypothetical protein